MKIKELQLHNFKFFTGTDNTLHINGKNVLVWGENGSGKSSIYWSIYTLLQCSYKDQQGIDDYFTENFDKNLLNIHKPVGDDAFIQMVLDVDKPFDVVYRVALNDYSIIGDTDVQLSAVSSDFINYQVLASFLSFYHRDNPILFKMFEEEIFRFLQFSPPTPYTFAFFNEAWEELKKPLIKSKVGKTNKYPNPQSTTYINKNNLKNAFNIQLQTLLGNVTTKANQILQDPDGFNLDMEIELEYRGYEFEVSARNSEYRETMPEIFLKVRRYNGLADVVKKPHSFLNEAKKTAIGLAIRLGILERRLLADKLNVLALDDLLISLDMSNREVVLKLLFEEYQNDYQLLIFTHDKQFFNIAKNKIENAPFKDNWLFWEFYVNEKDPNKHKPRFFETQSQLSVAFNHLQESDYPAAANYLRKQCEHLIEKYLPQYCYRDVNKDKSHKNYPLDGMLTNSALFCDRINASAVKAILILLKQYVEMLLNPLSHTERGVDRHKGEIKEVIRLLDGLETELKKLRFSKMPIVPINTDLYLNLVKDPIITYKIQIKLKEDLFAYDNGGVIHLSKCLIDSVYFWHYQNTALHQEGNFTFHSNKDLAVSYGEIAGFGTISVPVIPNWETLFTKLDGTILNTLMVL
ncbi:MAG: AAA family ATPase [Chitinophagaceae bacterium]